MKGSFTGPVRFMRQSAVKNIKVCWCFLDRRFIWFRVSENVSSKIVTMFVGGSDEHDIFGSGRQSHQHLYLKKILLHYVFIILDRRWANAVYFGSIEAFKSFNIGIYLYWIKTVAAITKNFLM
jgi:hypothetical protein